MAKARDYSDKQIEQAKKAIDDAIKKTLSTKYITQERREILEYNAITVMDAQFDGKSVNDAYDRAYSAAFNIINSWKFDFLKEDEDAKMNKTTQPQTQPATVKTSEATPKPTEDKPDNKNMLIIVAVVAVIIVGVCIFFMTKKK